MKFKSVEREKRKCSLYSACESLLLVNKYVRQELTGKAKKGCISGLH